MCCQDAILYEGAQTPSPKKEGNSAVCLPMLVCAQRKICTGLGIGMAAACFYFHCMALSTMWSTVGWCTYIWGFQPPSTM